MRTASLLLAAVLLALAAGLAWAWSAAGRAAAAAAEAQRTQQVLTALATLRAAALEIDTALDNPEALPRAQAAAQAQQATLRTLLASDAEAYANVVALYPLLARRVEMLSAPRNALAPADVRRQQERIRSAFAELQRAAIATSGTAQQHAQAAAARARWAAVLPGAATLLLLALAGARLQHGSRHVQHARVQAQAADAGRQLADEALGQLFATVPDALAVLDSEGRFVRANDGCEALWGLPAQALAGRACIELVAEDDRRRTELAMRAAVAQPGRVQIWRNRCVHTDGSRRNADWRGVWSDSQRVLLCTAHDSTDDDALRAGADSAHAALQAEHDEAVAQRSRADAAGRINAGFIHALGERMRAAPLAITSLADILLQGLGGPLTREQQRELKNIRGHAHKLQALLGAGLDVAAIAAGTLRLERQPFDVWETVNEAAAEARDALLAKGLALNLQLADDLGYARGDVLRVAQVLRELLANAARCTEHGGVKLGAARDGDAVRITVADSGAGIAPERLETLFEPFANGSEAPPPGAGPGLGLAVCRGLARLMGGELAAASEPGRGSTFTFTLPADTLQPEKL